MAVDARRPPVAALGLARLASREFGAPSRAPSPPRVAVEIARQGFDLQLTRYDERGWRATVYTTGMEHSPTSATGTGWEPTPWHATQWAA
jgi:hypothetical protein